MPAKKKAAATRKPAAKKVPKAKTAAPPKKLSALDAAAQVLAEGGANVRCAWPGPVRKSREMYDILGSENRFLFTIYRQDPGQLAGNFRQ